MNQKLRDGPYEKDTSMVFDSRTHGQTIQERSDEKNEQCRSRSGDAAVVPDCLVALDRNQWSVLNRNEVRFHRNTPGVRGKHGAR